MYTPPTLVYVHPSPSRVHAVQPTLASLTLQQRCTTPLYTLTRHVAEVTFTVAGVTVAGVINPGINLSGD